MKIYTRTGDQGQTGLFGGGRVSKDHARIEAYGTVDELNSVLGWVRASMVDSPHVATEQILSRIQGELFVLGSDLATPADATVEVPRIADRHILQLENDIDSVDDQLEPLKRFILPGGAIVASNLHIARTVCRRAERRVVSLSGFEPINEVAVVYLNRLSDLLFMLARWANMIEGEAELLWEAE